MVWNAIELIKNSIKTTGILTKLREEYNRIGDDPNEDFVDASKMNKDIKDEIREARRLFESVGFWFYQGERMEKSLPKD